ncbi:MAG: hypothetical protein KDB26_08885 [Microthrixaceae bacterium]|nr:hypothetical protein [Microthrixaceae bacterium]
MKAYRNAALFSVSLAALGIVTAGSTITPEYILFLVSAAVGVLAVVALTVKALREDQANR